MAPRSDNISFEDAVLVRQTQEGDIQAFEKLVIKYQDRVFNICFKVVTNHEDARDLAQETFLKALDGINKFEHMSSFYTWLFRIAVNLCISHLRKGRKMKMQSLNGPSQGSGRPGQALKLHARSGDHEAVQLLEAMMNREIRQAVTNALGELQDDYRTILVLRDMESLDYEAIANILGIPIGTVRSRLHRARLAMRKLLKPVLEKAG